MNRSKQTRSVLFVCMGNICRSPAAEGVFRKLVDDAGVAGHFEIDSAGTIGYPSRERDEPGLDHDAGAAGKRGNRIWLRRKHREGTLSARLTETTKMTSK